MTTIIDGRKIKDDVLKEVQAGVLSLPFVPIFCDILVGNDLTSIQYVNLKSKMAQSIGIKFRTAEFPASTTTEEIIEEIQNLNKVPHMCGIIVQLPLPDHINKSKVFNAIDPSLDVDCLSEKVSDKFYTNDSYLSYPTALACVKILDSLNLDFSDKKIVVLGTGFLVGRPVAHLLEDRGLLVKTANNKTENINDLLKDADVIISGIGKGKFITGEMIKEGAVIIDAGTSETNGSVVGDVDIDSVVGIASFVTPTPGGVGPVTVAMLLNNILTVARRKLL